MKLAIFAALAGSAAAFVPQNSIRASVVVNGALDDLKDIAKESNPVLKVRFYHSAKHVEAVLCDCRSRMKPPIRAAH